MEDDADVTHEPHHCRGEGHEKNRGSTRCTSSHPRKNNVRAAQDRWVPQLKEITPARQERP
jgi:hypothetical protein